MDQIIFREEIKKEDVNNIREIVTSTRFFRDDEIKIATELAKERLAAGPASGYNFLFAEIEGKVVAYCCYGPVPCSLVSYDIYWIATKADLQGKGVGSTLLGKVESVISSLGGESVFLETSSKKMYEPTLGFYQRNGYATEAILSDFYERGDGKVILRKRL